jgi:hypothetical protein
VVKRTTIAALMLASACKPELAGRPSEVDKDVVVAVRSSPAEVNPGAMPAPIVTYEALYIGPGGPPDPSALDWAFCDVPKPLALTGPISQQCLVRRARDIKVTIAPAADGGEPTTQVRHILTPFGAGLTARSSVPDDGYRVFGPFPPDPQPGEPPSRPADPDTTGGYYQPVRLLIPTKDNPEFSVGVTRLDCGISGANADQTLEYNKRHVPNENPAIASVVLRHANGRKETLTAEPGASTTSGPADGGASVDGAAVADAGAGSSIDSGGALTIDAGPTPHVTVAPGESVSLTASWANCAVCTGSGCGAPTPCAGSESYVNLDLIEHRIVAHRESIRVSWFSANGSFEHDRTGRAEAEAKTTNTENTWTAPNTEAEVNVWVVIRDDRGGVGWSSYVIHVAR